METSRMVPLRHGAEFGPRAAPAERDPRLRETPLVPVCERSGRLSAPRP